MTATTANAIVARGLTKRFGATTAVDGIDLTIPEGTVFGLLGPNGAGKTTIVSILATLITPDKGQASVLGYDVTAQAHQVRRPNSPRPCSSGPAPPCRAWLSWSSLSRSSA
jgi:ABC-type multidrug transport system ATPase subunit